MEAPELKPCPFCRSPMEWWGKDMFRHAEPINQKCPIALMAFTKSDIWNTRAPDPDLDAAVNES